MSSDEIMIKLGIFGGSSTGKSLLLNLFVNETINPEREIIPKCEIVEKIITIGKQTIYLKIWDTSGQERLNMITRQYYQGLQGLMLIYDQTDRNSFSLLSKWFEKMSNEIVLEKTGIVVVANKSDSKNKEVLIEEGKSFAEKIGAPFIETSVVKNINIEECFNILVQEVLKKCPEFDRDKKSTVWLRQNKLKSKAGCPNKNGK